MKAKLIFSIALALLALRTHASTVFPIATNGVASQAGIFAAFGGSNYLVGIQGDGTTNSAAITAQLVSTNGTLLGSRILTGHTGGMPYVASGATNYLLVWSDNKLVVAGGNDQLYGQFVSRSGALVGSPFTFGPTSEEQDMREGGGSLLVFDGRNFLAVGDTGAFHDASTGNVHGVLFSQTGSKIGSIISITSGANAELTPIVPFGKTNYLVVWNDASSGNIDGEFISTNGSPGSSFVISQTTTPSYNPLCAAFDGTNFMVVWNKNLGGITPNNIWNLYGRGVSPSGTFPGNEVAMVTDANFPVWPSLAFGGTDYLMAWLARSSSQVQFQFFNPSASPVGGEFNLFSPQGTNTPVFAGVLFDGSRFEITAAVGASIGGTDFTRSTGTWGTFHGTTPPLVVTTTALPNGTNSVAYTQSLAAFGGQTPYRWTNSSGTLPPGLTLATNGVISETPTNSGTNYFTVKVTDALFSTATQALILTVIPLQVTTTALPNGTNGLPYSQQLSAVSGRLPFSWSLMTGSLPSGLTLATNGVISGTPTTIGTNYFTVKVTDALFSTATQALALTVLALQGQGNGVFYEIPKSEYDALVDLYNSTGGNAWTTQTGWLNPNATSWSGIGISGVQYDINGNVSVQGNVTVINLQQFGLSGSIPASIGNFSQLYYLRLSFNQLTGSIPSSIGNLQQLWLLYLHYNNLRGPIPDTMGNLPNVQYLYLVNNDLNGEIPSSLGNLTGLLLCGLGENQFSGSIPSSFGNLISAVP